MEYVTLLNGEECPLDEAVTAVGGWVREDDDAYVEVEDHDEVRHPVEDCVWSEAESRWILREEAVELYDGDCCHRSYRHVRYSRTEMEHFIEGDANFAYTMNHGYVRTENSFCCEECGEQYHEDDYGHDGMCSSCADDHDEGGPGRINGYHESGLEVGVLCASTNHHLDRWTVGFEVEKAHNGYSYGDSIEETPLFAYWEEDGSCGIEGVTHAYSITNRDLFDHHVERSRRLLNLQTNDRCGGHTTLAGPDLSLEKIRRYAGLVYALFRSRLNNSFCGDDKPLTGTSGGRYCCIRKRFGPRNGVSAYEFRLCSKIQNPRQLQNRFEFFGILADSIHHDISFRAYLRRNTKLLRRIYPDPEKRNQIRSLAWEFHRYLQEGTVGPNILQFV